QCKVWKIRCWGSEKQLRQVPARRGLCLQLRRPGDLQDGQATRLAYGFGTDRSRAGRGGCCRWFARERSSVGVLSSCPAGILGYLASGAGAIGLGARKFNLVSRLSGEGGRRQAKDSNNSGRLRTIQVSDRAQALLPEAVQPSAAAEGALPRPDRG